MVELRPHFFKQLMTTIIFHLNIDSYNMIVYYYFNTFWKVA